MDKEENVNMEMEDNPHPLNPLAVDVVVQEILRHVSPSMKDLLVFRQVCRLWRELATPIISSRSLELPMITFEGVQAEGKRKNSEDSNSADCRACKPEYSLLPKYIDYLEGDFQPKIIFSVFHFNAISLDHPLVQRFLEEFGDTVKSLRLNYTDCDNTGWHYYRPKCDQIRKFEPETFRRLLLSCPNLEETVLRRVGGEGGENRFLLPDDDFQMKIKRMAWVVGIPFYDYLEYLHLPAPGGEEEFISDMLKVCPSLERFLTDCELRFTKVLSQSPHLSALKELKIPQGREFQQLIEGEQQGKMQLRKLKFKELHMADEPEELCRFLDTQKSSLETLIVGNWRVDGNGFNQPPRVQIPDVMGKLEVLKIVCLLSRRELMADEPDPIFLRLLFEPLDFRRQFPVLKTLILGGEARRYDFNDLFAPGWEPQLVLEGLELPTGALYQLGHIADLFPNVKYLTLGAVGDNELRVVWTQWPLLESLFLVLHDEDFEDTDSIAHIETALTGLSSEEVALAQSLIENGEEINIQAEFPSIVNCQNLKELRILLRVRSGNDLPGKFLSNISIHYSLSKMVKLEFLGVNNHKFTDEGINFLCNVRGLKWNKDGSGMLKCQKDLELEYKPRPNCDESFADYEINERREEVQEQESDSESW